VETKTLIPNPSFNQGTETSPGPFMPQKPRSSDPVATEIRIEPTLFIFLGTSAGQVGWRLKQIIRQAYGDIPVIRYLWIDTDSTLEPVAARFFEDQERATLIGFDGDEVLAYLNMYPAILQFWPRNSRLKPGFIRRGAKQIRLYGRLALFRMFNERGAGPALIDRLASQLDALQLIENFDATERQSSSRRRYVVERGSARVWIITTTCGGTGSSMTWDVAYLCRHRLRGVNPTINAVAILPPVVDLALRSENHQQMEKIRANTYAWFKEHEYLLEHPYWQIAYPEGAPLDVHSSAFDLSFVVDLVNQAGDRLNNEDDVFSMVAQALFLDTGHSIGGALRGFNANVSVLNSEFQGRWRAYSGVGAASIVYPIERILNYSGARFGKAILQGGLLNQSQATPIQPAAEALVERLGLVPARLMENLLAGRQVDQMNLPAIRRAKTVQALRDLLLAQEGQNAQARERHIQAINAAAAQLSNQLVRELWAEIARLAARHGLVYAQELLQQLSGDHQPGLATLKSDLVQQGVTEADLAQAQRELVAAKERLRALDGDWLQSAFRLLLRRAWERELGRARADCMQWLTEQNHLYLQLAAQRAVTGLYGRLTAQLDELSAQIAEWTDIAQRASQILDRQAVQSLEPAGLQQGIYELALEAVDGAYLQAYYASRGPEFDASEAARSFVAERAQGDLTIFGMWEPNGLAQRLLEFARQYFAPELEATSLLQALAEYHGADAPQVIESLFDRLVRYCHPFCQYERNRGLQGVEGKSIIGVEDEHSELIPARYRNNRQFELKSTGFKHRIDLARVQHGLPAFLLRGMDDYQAYYQSWRKSFDPLHVIPEAVDAPEVIPDQHQQSRQTFATASAFDYIVQIGSWYYFDPNKDYCQRQIHPGRENRLAQGRENAALAFARRPDLVRQAENLIEAEIATMGNRAAIAHLEERLTEIQQALANMPPESDLRQQYEKEMRTLAEKQRYLGFLGQTAVAL
jgi:hypothetical protein